MKPEMSLSILPTMESIYFPLLFLFFALTAKKVASVNIQFTLSMENFKQS